VRKKKRVGARADAHVCACVWMLERKHANVCSQPFTYTHTSTPTSRTNTHTRRPHTHTHKYTQPRARAHAHIHTHTHTHTQTHTHTHTQIIYGCLQAEKKAQAQHAEQASTKVCVRQKMSHLNIMYVCVRVRCVKYRSALQQTYDSIYESSTKTLKA